MKFFFYLRKGERKNGDGNAAEKKRWEMAMYKFCLDFLLGNNIVVGECSF